MTLHACEFESKGFEFIAFCNIARLVSDQITISVSNLYKIIFIKNKNSQ